MAESIAGMGRLLRDLTELARRSRDRRAPLKEAAGLMAGSVRENFDSGGRPRRWKAHAESTRRRVVGPQRLLVRSGRLRDSFKPRSNNDEASADSNVVYGPRQHFGYPGGPGRGHSPTPARPFALLQEKDVRTIGDRVFMRHLFG